MTFLAEEQSNIFEASYKVGSETFVYKAATGFLQNYEPGEQVTIIYNPSNPQTACVYSFIGYWVQWGELFFTAAFFTLLFAVARYITIPVYKSETLVLAE